MILRPQQKRQKERQKMLDAVKKGDKVVTAGGMHGDVAGMDEKTDPGPDRRQREDEVRPSGVTQPSCGKANTSEGKEVASTGGSVEL